MATSPRSNDAARHHPRSVDRLDRTFAGHLRLTPRFSVTLGSRSTTGLHGNHCIGAKPRHGGGKTGTRGRNRGGMDIDDCQSPAAYSLAPLRSAGRSVRHPVSTASGVRSSSSVPPRTARVARLARTNRAGLAGPVVGAGGTGSGWSPSRVASGRVGPLRASPQPSVVGWIVPLRHKAGIREQGAPRPIDRDMAAFGAGPKRNL
jgi:hypothetical protein